jgi:hypothetical protein
LYQPRWYRCLSSRQGIPAVTVATSKGPAGFPAWRFTVTGLSWPVTESAVAAGTAITLPSPFPLPAAGRDVPGVAQLTAASGDGRTLSLPIITGACVSTWGARLYQSGTAVVVGSFSGGDNAQSACPAMALSRSARVTLQSPPGSRVVLDVASGEPLVLGGPMLG